MVRYRESSFFDRDSNKMEDLLWLINNGQHVKPKRIGEVQEVSPAILYAEDEDTSHVLHIGKPQDFFTGWAHEDIAKEEAPTSYRRISAVTILADTGIHLAIDGDSAKRRGGLERFQHELAHESDDVFVGGFSEYEDVSVGARTIDTVGLIRTAAKWVNLGRNERFTRDQTKLAFEISNSQLANGLPMHEFHVIELVKKS